MRQLSAGAIRRRAKGQGLIQDTTHLLGTRRFLPMFVTQFLGAFNDNLFRTAVVMLVIYGIYQSAEQETTFSALAGALYILPFFVLSALAGQLADAIDKARIVRAVKTAEILIMVVGAAGLILMNIPLMLGALMAMGIHSTFFGPIKYAILPQHLDENEVLGGTGLVEAGTYIAVLGGTILGGLLIVKDSLGNYHAEYAAIVVFVVTLAGRLAAQFVPPAPPSPEQVGASNDPDLPRPLVDWQLLRASVVLVKAVVKVPRLFLGVLAISMFWAMGAVLGALFPPLVKNVFGGNQSVATLFLAVFSIGVATGSLVVNRLLKSEVSARFAAPSAMLMGASVAVLWLLCAAWTPYERLVGVETFLAEPTGWPVLLTLFAVAAFGGMYVVPLYAFITTTVPRSETARTVAANNIVSSGAMVGATLLLFLLIQAGISVADTLLLVVAGAGLSTVIGVRLDRANRASVAA